MASALTPSGSEHRLRRGAVIVTSAMLVAGAVVVTTPTEAAANPNPARITDASWWLMQELEKLQPGSLNGGIYNNKPGYHNTRAANKPSDYSVQDAEDRGGPSDKAAAYDWTFPEAQSRALRSLDTDPHADQHLPSTVTAEVSNFANIARFSNRLLASGRDPDDPRMNGWREFFGQTDNDLEVESWDFRYRRPTSTDDPSHVWHIHLSEDRDKVESYENKRALLSVLRGETVAQWLNTDVGGPAVVRAEGEYHLFGISPSGQLSQNTWRPGGWLGWESLGGTVAGTPAVTYHDGQYDVFARSPRGVVYQKTWRGTWSDWKSIGGIIEGGLAAVYANGEYHVFGISPSGQLSQNTWRPGGWLGWESLGGTVAGTPAVTYHDGQYDVFARSPSGTVYQKTWRGTWSDWKSIGGKVEGGLGAVHANGEYHVFGISPSGQLSQNTWRPGGWLGWESLGGTVAGTPAVTYHDGQYDVFARSPRGVVYQKPGKAPGATGKPSAESSADAHRP
ncbi:hypothetical protein GCM10029963_48790 [Micromonospora andamanensis]